MMSMLSKRNFFLKESEVYWGSNEKFCIYLGRGSGS